MPIYEYVCQACKEQFEHLARTMNDGTPVSCPACASTRTARTLSVFAVGGESAGRSSPAESGPTGCGRCGGPNPCSSDF